MRKERVRGSLRSTNSDRSLDVKKLSLDGETGIRKDL